MEKQTQHFQNAEDFYRPGVCNIGAAETRKRRNEAIFMGAITLAEVILLLMLDANKIWRLTLFIPATALGINFQQWIFRFSVGFAIKGVYNFGDIGEVFLVEQKEDLIRDRTGAGRIVSTGIGFGAFAAIVFYFFSI